VFLQFVPETTWFFTFLPIHSFKDKLIGKKKEANQELYLRAKPIKRCGSV
jgi:hypothetical protein